MYIVAMLDLNAASSDAVKKPSKYWLSKLQKKLFDMYVLLKC